MGLLDKTNNAESSTPAAKPVAKAKAVAKPVAKAVAKPAVAKAAKPVKEQKARTKRTPRPKGLPEDFQLATTMNRQIAGWTNFVINFTLIFIGVFLAMSDTGVVTTILFMAGIGVYLTNNVVLPLWVKRNVGQFVARTKYVNSKGQLSNVGHSLLTNTLGIFFIVGLFFFFDNLSDFRDDNNAMVWFIVSFVLMAIPISNYFVKRNTQMRQGLYDLLFASYYVKHVPSKEEKAASGWMAKFESMGDYGEKFQANREKRAAEKAAKEAKKQEEAEKKAQEAEIASEEAGETETEDQSSKSDD